MPLSLVVVEMPVGLTACTVTLKSVLVSLSSGILLQVTTVLLLLEHVNEPLGVEPLGVEKDASLLVGV